MATRFKRNGDYACARGGAKTAKGYQILDADAVVLETRSSQLAGLAVIESSGKINSVQVAVNNYRNGCT